MTQTRENRLFLGNPGTGKSTLINCMIGYPVFKSGLSWGSGLTQAFQSYNVNGITYMDTPGLADRKILKQAAGAIKEALSQPGRYKLFFMVRLQAGRVMSEDVDTIDQVLDAINLRNIEYTVVINKLGKKQLSKLLREGDEYWEVYSAVNSGKYSTEHICFVRCFEELEDEDNAVIELPRGVTTFIDLHAPVIDIPRNAVSDIHVWDSYVQEAYLREQYARHHRAQEELAAVQREQARLEAAHRAEMERIGAQHLRNMQQAQARHQTRRRDSDECSIL